MFYNSLLCVVYQIFLHVEKMDHFSENPFFGGQTPFMGSKIFLTPSSYGAFQPFSAQVGERSVEEIQETIVERVEEPLLEEVDCEIVGSSKKRGAPKQKALPKEKTTSKRRQQ